MRNEYTRKPNTVQMWAMASVMIDVPEEKFKEFLKEAETPDSYRVEYKYKYYDCDLTGELLELFRLQGYVDWGYIEGGAWEDMEENLLREKEERKWTLTDM